MAGEARAGQDDRRTGAAGYLPALDGLRAVAVAGVIAFHAGVSWLPGGFLGVSAFFTLSGFLITRLLLEERARTGTIDLAAFWGRRIRRLWPASLACLAGVVVAGRWLATDAQRLALRGDVLAALAQVANWRQVAAHHGYQALVADPSPLQHYWSLAIEEQFYLVFPLLLLGVLRSSKPVTPPIARRFPRARAARRQANRRALQALAVVLGGAVVATGYAAAGPWSDAYYATQVRLAELVLGCLLAAACRLRPLGALVERPLTARSAAVAAGAAAVVAVLWATVRTGDPWLFRGLLLVHAAAVGVVIVAAVRPGAVQQALAWRPLVEVGQVSYGLYLFHWPVFLWVKGPVADPWPGPVLLAVRLGITVALTLASYWLVEHPVRRGGRLPGYRLAMVLPSAATVVVILAVTLPGPPGDGPKDVVRASLASTARAAPIRTHAAGVPRSPLGRPIRLFTIGDSFGYQVAFSLEPWMDRYPGRFVGVGTDARPGCGLVTEGTISSSDARVRGPVGDGCEDVVGRAERSVEVLNPDVALVVSGVWDVVSRRWPGDPGYSVPGDPGYDDRVVAAYEQVVDALGARGALVVFVPWPCIAPTKITGFDPASGMDQDRLDHLYRVLLPKVLAARPDNTAVVPVDHELCARGRVRATDGRGRPLRMDDGMHPSPIGLSYVRDELMTGLLAEVRASKLPRLQPGSPPPVTEPITASPSAPTGT